MTVVGADEVAQRATTFELAVANSSKWVCTGLVITTEASTQMSEVIDVLEQQPGSKALFLAYQIVCLRNAAPDQRSAILRRVNGDNSRSGIPAPEPLVPQSVLRWRAPQCTNERRERHQCPDTFQQNEAPALIMNRDPGE